MAYSVKLRFEIENEQFPPLHSAMYNGEMEKVISMLERFKTRRAQRENLNEICSGFTPLDIAIATQNEDMVQLLLQQPGIQINTLPDQAEPSLSRAAALPFSVIMQALLQRDIDINYQDHG